MLRDDTLTLAAATDDAYAMPLAVTIGSALDKLGSGSRIRLFVLDGGLSEESKGKLLASWDEMRVEVRWIRPDEGQLQGLEGSRHVSRATYFRILMPQLVPAEVGRVIYLDADLLVRGDLGRLWDEEQGDAVCLAAADTAAPYLNSREALPSYGRCGRFLAANEPIPNYRELGLAASNRYFNAGVLVVDLDRWRKLGLTEKLLACLREQRQHVQWWDQYALNVVLAGQWRELDPRWNQGVHAYTFPSWQESPFDEATYRNLRHDPWIVHFTSHRKPWHYYCRHPFRGEYLRAIDQTAWRGWRPELPKQNITAQWWAHRFAPVRHWVKVYSTRARRLAGIRKRAA